MFESTIQDVRYAVRLIRRSPLFAATAILSVAIGIGANTTIFAVASAMLLRPPPGVQNRPHLVDIGRTQDGEGFDNSSYPNFVDVRARVTTLTDVYAMKLEAQPMSLGGADGAERIYGTLVSANYFTVLGVTPAAGRLLIDDDDRAGAAGHAVMVISHELWQRRFGGDPGIVGRAVTLNGQPFAVVGIAPRGFQGTTLVRTDAWLPMSATAAASPRLGADMLTSRRAVWLLMGGRLRPGVTLAQANAEIAAIGHNLEREHPDENRGKGLTAMASAVVPGHIDIFAGFLGLLMAIVGVVLLVACVNLSGMLLARAAARQRETAVRLAIGASRWRLARQAVVEVVVLFAAGGGLGIVLGGWLRGLLLALLPTLPIPIGIDMPIDARVLAFATLISLLAAMISGLAPALHATRGDLVTALKAAGTAGGARLRLRSVFLVGQIAGSFLLVVIAGLFMRTLGRATLLPTGFDQTNVDVAMLDLSLAGYTDVTGPGFAANLVRELRRQPGVQAAALAADLPLDGGRMGFGQIRTPGVQRGGSEAFDADWNVVSPGFFRTLNVPLVAGRDFSDADAARSLRVAIVNRAMARAIWGDADPIGRTIELGDESTWEATTIVGLAADARVISLDGPVRPYVYVPLTQRYIPRVSLLVKTSDAHGIPLVRSIVRRMDPNLPISQALPLTEITAFGLVPQRIAGAVAGSLGLVGLLLAAIGIYGVTSYSVARRVREIGIRMALGADKQSVLRLVLRQGLALTAVGVAIGAAAAAILAQLIRSLLFGIRPLDPVSFTAAAVLLTLAAALAAAGPARRAAGVDPMLALRAE
jgi:predicted permease